MRTVTTVKRPRPKVIGMFVGRVKRLARPLTVRRERRHEAALRDLAHTQFTTRLAILRLSSELGSAGLEARKEMIRQAYLACGHLPERP